MDWTHFQNRLRSLRKKKGVSASTVSELIGNERSSVSAYERGRRRPSVVTLQKLADYFEVSVDYLLGLKD